MNSLRNFNNVLLFLHAVEAARDHIDGWYPVFLPVSKGLCGLSGFGLCVVSSGLCMQSPPVSTSLSGLCMQSPPMQSPPVSVVYAVFAVNTDQNHQGYRDHWRLARKMHKQVETVMTRETTGDCKCDWCLQHHTRRDLHTICTFPWRSQPCAEEMVTRKRSGASDA